MPELNNATLPRTGHPEGEQEVILNALSAVFAQVPPTEPYVVSAELQAASES